MIILIVKITILQQMPKNTYIIKLGFLSTKMQQTENIVHRCPGKYT